MDRNKLFIASVQVLGLGLAFGVYRVKKGWQAARLTTWVVKHFAVGKISTVFMVKFETGAMFSLLSH